MRVIESFDEIFSGIIWMLQMYCHLLLMQKDMMELYC